MPGDATGMVGEVLRVLQGLGVVPTWAVYLTALLVAIVVVVMAHFSPFAAIKQWLASLPAPDPGPPEAGASPPMGMPEGGMSVPGPGDRWKDGGDP